MIYIGSIEKLVEIKYYNIGRKKDEAIKKMLPSRFQEEYEVVKQYRK